MRLCALVSERSDMHSPLSRCQCQRSGSVTTIPRPCANVKRFAS